MYSHHFGALISDDSYCYHSQPIQKRDHLKDNPGLTDTSSALALKKEATGESTGTSSAPLRASHISAHVELTPPTSNGTEVQENVTKANVLEIQRYLRWADEAMKKPTPHKQARRRVPKAA